MGIDTDIVQNTSSFRKQKYDDQHEIWAHALVIYSFDKVSYVLAASQMRPYVPTLTWAIVVNVSNYIQKIPNVQQW